MTKRVLSITLVMLLVFCMCSVAYADNEPSLAGADAGEFANLFTKLSDLLKNIFAGLQTLSIPVAGVALVICGIKILWGNAKSAEEGKSLAVKLVVAMVIIWGAPTIINIIKNATQL